MFARKELNEKIEINVKYLKRGIYYLHIQTNKNKDKPKEIIRVTLTQELSLKSQNAFCGFKDYTVAITT